VEFHQIPDRGSFVHSKCIRFNENVLFREPVEKLRFVLVEFDIVDGSFAAEVASDDDALLVVCHA